MTLEKIVAISGKPGLYQIISQSAKGLIVESLIDKKRMPVNALQNVSVLNDIAIYTHEGEEPLRTIFKTIAEKVENKEVLDHKESNDKLTDFFSEILPNYDEERVYASNIKKVVQWYNLLAKNQFDFASIKDPEEITE
jgi:argininosuccinate lyase